MESQPQNPEFRINPENFHSCRRHMELFKLYGINAGGTWNYLNYMKYSCNYSMIIFVDALHHSQQFISLYMAPILE